MAASGASLDELNFSSNFNAMNLKEKYGIAVNWSEEQWIYHKLDKSKLKRLVNSTRYWKIKLQEAFGDFNVILTLYSEAPGGFLSLQAIVDNVVAQFPGIEVESYNRFRNPRYMNIDFKDMNMRNRVLEGLKKVENFEVCFLSWAPQSSNHTLRVHWLPKKVPITKIALSLNIFFEHRFIKKEIAVHADGKAYGCGIATFVGKLKFGVEMDNVPHILQICGLDALLTIPSRLPLCLQCDKVGHKANECRSSYCRTCKSMKAKIHQCVSKTQGSKTYAQTLKADEEEEQFEDDDFVFTNTDHVSQEEYYRIEAHQNRGKENTIDDSDADSARKFIKVSPQTPGTHLPTNDNEILNKPLAGGTENTHQTVNMEKEKSPELMELETAAETGSSSELVEGTYIVVQKKNNKTPKNKDSANKEKILKQTTIPITYSSKPNRPTTRSSNMFDLLVAKQEGFPPPQEPPVT